MYFVVVVYAIGQQVYSRIKESNKAWALPPQRVLYLALWSFVPLAVIWTLSRVWHPCFTDRYVLYSAPAVCLLVAGGIAQLPKRAKIAVLTMALCVYVWQFSASPWPWYPDWRAVGKFVSAESREQEKVCLDYACSETLLFNEPRLSSQIRVCNSTEEFLAAVQSAESIWVIVSDDWSIWFEPDTSKVKKSFHTTVFPGNPIVRVYHIGSENP